MVSFWTRQGQHSLPATILITVIWLASVEAPSHACHQWVDEDEVRCDLKPALQDSHSSHHGHSSDIKWEGTLRSARTLLPDRNRSSNRFHRTFSRGRLGIQSAHLPGKANRLETMAAIIAPPGSSPVGFALPTIPRINLRQPLPCPIGQRQVVTRPQAHYEKWSKLPSPGPANPLL